MKRSQKAHDRTVLETHYEPGSKLLMRGLYKDRIRSLIKTATRLYIRSFDYGSYETAGTRT